MLVFTALTLALGSIHSAALRLELTVELFSRRLFLALVVEKKQVNVYRLEGCFPIFYLTFMRLRYSVSSPSDVSRKSDN